MRPKRVVRSLKSRAQLCRLVRVCGVAVIGALLAGCASGDSMVSADGTAPVFEVDPMWPQPLPDRWLLGSAVGVAIDDRDHVFVLHRTDSFNARTEIGAASDPPTGKCCRPAPAVLEFDAAGGLVNSWGGPGEDYVWPTENHGIAIDPDGNVWIGGSAGTDSHLLKFSPQGDFLMGIGVPAGGGEATGAGGGVAGALETAPQRGGDAQAARGGQAGRAGRGGRGGRGGGEPAGLPPNSRSMESFGGPAQISFDPDAGVAFVADGYRNRRVAVVDIETGEIQRFWGAYGNEPVDEQTPAYQPGGTPSQQFGTPVRCAERANDGLIYVCDATNDRLQVFRADGTFVEEAMIASATLGAGSAWDVAFSADPDQRFLYVADGSNMKVHVLDRESLQVLTTFGDGGRQPGEFIGVHSLATDSQGNLYTVETFEGKRVQKFLFRGLGSVDAAQGVVWPEG